jgi:hypothetical protein
MRPLLAGNLSQKFEKISEVGQFANCRPTGGWRREGRWPAKYRDRKTISHPETFLDV